MKNKSTFVCMLGLTLLGSYNVTSAQNYVVNGAQEIVHSASGGNDIPRDVAVIDNTLERKVVVGSYQPGASGFYNGFIRCFDQNDDLKWYIQVEGNGNDEVNGVDCRSRVVGIVNYGDIYVTGYFTGTMTMVLHYGFPIHHFTSTIYTRSAPSGNANDCTYFVSKFDQDGAHIWTQVSGDATATNTEIGNDVDVNVVSGVTHVYTTGFFRGDCSFYTGTTPGTAQSSAASWNSVFVVDYTDAGSSSSVQWVRAINDNSNNQHDYGYGVVGDASGNIYATGSIGGTTTVGATTMNVEGNDDAFAIQYNSAGTMQWVKDFGGNGTVATPSDQGRGIDYRDNAIYVCGYYNGSGDFPSWSSSHDAFLVKMDAATGGWGWKNMIMNGTGSDVAYHTAVSEDGTKVYVVGSMTGDANIKCNSVGNVATIPSVSSGAYANGFFVSFEISPDALFDWEWLGDDNEASVTTGVAYLSDQEVYTVGGFRSYFLYDQIPNVMLTNSNYGTLDGFYTKYDSGLAPRYAAPGTQIPGGVKRLTVEAWPNPATDLVTISASTKGASTVEVL
ncbi:MAG TPA: hypothetical protein VK826_16040, partial [Bacteroidia bacterium]|nr:hypothetical protein [Bacteroidia bacterium]